MATGEQVAPRCRRRDWGGQMVWSSGEAGGGEAARGLWSEERDGETAGRQAAAARRPSRRQAMGEREQERERATSNGGEGGGGRRVCGEELGFDPILY
jgi:hypothetical protein